MTEEELKAIKNYKMFEDAIKQTISKGDRELYIDNLEAALRDTRILLNLIEKQQEEIENSVSKDKIRELIEKLEGHIWKDGYMTKFDKYAIHYLKELLEVGEE